MSQNLSTVRPPTLLDVSNECATAGAAAWDARGQNFHVAWRRAGDAPLRMETASADELMLIVLDAPVAIEAEGRAPVNAPARTIAILPAGAWHLALAPRATCAVLRSLREDAVDAPARNAQAYRERDPRIVPVGAPYRALRDADAVRLLPIDQVQASKDKPRLKMLQTATMSINWVEYEGPRDRSALSPHAHSQFEQGSLALAGDFVHHLRTPWGADAGLWQDDRHAALGAPSLMVVPVNLIHTSEGVGPGHHVLIDIFSPPRADFIANQWVYNASDYVAG
ncbi:hypothetical protein [Hydrogenophaga sp. BPS33]|uniref:hypothetical protein n=1 Tax=Hydrogenophaga sp. BPS33 TaxID=2651974 RepID=UPI00132041DA|nr:hypothetical protein [Hydrogenophaga sp. BPS33]QHE88179.1 hypothetical protein F9K07_26420 [Hydrogenophaga sp. BPS33]